eukprot:TRINITY_DN2886_c0_g1_i1.p1 TRINITY_DN2886_c0_g1~~TRINITY_DN2886_c0_g1_i1.p1  ORF type:complete len:281 (-),score=51.42 TRINITY_DN2886_c0_g1_i1:86-928(-)
MATSDAESSSDEEPWEQLRYIGADEDEQTWQQPWEISVGQEQTWQQPWQINVGQEQTWQQPWEVSVGQEQTWQQPWEISVGQDLQDIIAHHLDAMKVGQGVEIASQEVSSRKTTATQNHVLRTRICSFYLRGTCTRGEACSFAHGEAYLQKKPKWQKTRLCKDLFQNGFCSAGAYCTWAHSREELVRSKKEPKEVSEHQSALRSMVKKTQVCKFHASGKCKLGSECTFAHGVEELQKKPDLSCTGLCRYVVQFGFCQLQQSGRCKFAHSEEELRQLGGNQ